MVKILLKIPDSGCAPKSNNTPPLEKFHNNSSTTFGVISKTHIVSIIKIIKLLIIIIIITPTKISLQFVCKFWSYWENSYNCRYPTIVKFLQKLLDLHRDSIITQI